MFRRVRGVFILWLLTARGMSVLCLCGVSVLCFIVWYVCCICVFKVLYVCVMFMLCFVDARVMFLVWLLYDVFIVIVYGYVMSVSWLCSVCPMSTLCLFYVSRMCRWSVSCMCHA